MTCLPLGEETWQNGRHYRHGRLEDMAVIQAGTGDSRQGGASEGVK